MFFRTLRVVCVLLERVSVRVCAHKGAHTRPLTARVNLCCAFQADGALEEAQHNKLQMVCDKLMLQEGESFLDIGCGYDRKRGPSDFECVCLRG